MTSVTVLPGARLKRAEPECTAPDSTTIEREMPEFCSGQDVLVKQKDERYYLGTVVQVDSVRDRCLIKFGDNTDNWASFKDLTKLATTEQEELLCVVCKKSAPKKKKEIVVCDQCGRGYHQKCHQPEIFIKDGMSWICKRCLDSEPHRLRRSETRLKNLKIQKPKVLPYDLSSLKWDAYHRTNSEERYCYCGSNGEWHKQMLQCGRCRQWFHERCIDALQSPLFCGDRFYVFVCSLCNHGKEFLRRLEIKWVDLVHLMLFNLTVFNCKKYYDLDTVIIPYINDNWHALQLSPKLQNCSKAERRNSILSVLTVNKNRFKCGREIKKKTSIWGLRVRLPPPAPLITLPPSGGVTEEELKDLWRNNRRLNILPEPEKRVVLDNHMRNLMMGVAYQQSSTHSESESSSSGAEDKKEIEVYSDSDRNFVAKKTAPFKALSLQRRKKLLAMTNRERMHRRPKRRLAREGTRRSGRGRAYTTRLSLDKSKEVSVPVSVSLPPTPPASNTTSVISDLSNDFSENSCKVKTSLELHTPCDTSGDETSSKSTLDLIIPPPKDFEGKNNPFLALLKGGEEVKKKKGKDGISLALPLTAVIPGKPIMRPIKRQLSEKDILIGPNGEVKRKRFRRGRGFPGKVKVEQRLEVRRLRQREKEKEKCEQTPPTPKPSPVKQEPEIDLDELKTSVNMYFGAANRIAGGERFCVKSKRVGVNGKVEYLIEWEGPGNGMT